MLSLNFVIPLATSASETSNGFLLHATVYLAAAVIGVPLAKRLGLGSILGYLAAGVLIGPYVLGITGSEGENVMRASEFGVVMMLFLIGLELHPSMLWRLRGPILGLGGLQVGVTALVIMGIGLALGLPWDDALTIGLCLALSSTAVVLQSLNEKGLTQSQGGQASFSVLLFQDIAFVPILAIIPFLSVTSGDQALGTSTLKSHWQAALLVVGVVAGIIIVGRYLTRPIFRFIAGARLREVFTASALLLVIGVALLMESVGLSPALGTFLAGVVLAESEFRHELESNIEPFKGLLLGIFFIAIGATMDFSLLAKYPLAITGIVLGLVLLKFTILFALGKLAKLGRDQNWLFSFALAQGGEFAFVLFAYANQVQALSLDMARLLTLATALSMTLTPLLLILHERVVAPRFQKPGDHKKADVIEEKNPIIIAGFGSFGNVIGRFLQANGIQTTILDTDPEHIEALRKMGFKVHYGDASRVDLLHAAGTEHARILIVTVNEREKARKIVTVAKKHFPKLKVYARALDYRHAAHLCESQVDKWRHQHASSALELGADVLTELGCSPFRAWRASRRFNHHEQATFSKLLKVHEGDHSFLDLARQSREEIEAILLADTAFKEVPNHAYDQVNLDPELTTEEPTSIVKESP